MAEVHEKHKKNVLSMKARIIMLLVIPLIVIGLSSAAIVITAQKIVPDDVYTETEDKSYPLSFYKEENEIREQLIGLLNDVTASASVAVKSEISVSVADDKIEGTLNDAQMNILKHIKGGILGDLSHAYDVYSLTDDGTWELKSSDYGEKADIFPAKNLFLSMTGVTCEDRENGTYTYKAQIPNEAAQGYYAAEHERVLKKLQKDYENVFTVLPDSSVELKTVTLVADVSAEYKTVKKISMERVYTVFAHLSFVGEYAALGEQSLTFEYKAKPAYSVSFAGIFINKKEIKIHKNGYEQLSLTTNVSPNAVKEDYTLTFTSSDESLITVDENGVVEATGTESPNPITVTATLTYLGNTYQASAEVYVITESDGINISDAKLSLKVGEEAVLSAEVTPKKATIKDVLWVSTDEAVATVDESGKVTAKAAGEARIIAVGKEGSFMEACYVTVTDK